jgi:recombinational DNA repair ATPase RecF
MRSCAHAAPRDVPELLDTFDEQLARAGARVVIRRRTLIEELAPGVDAIFRRLHGDLAVGLRYVSEPGVTVARSEGEVSAALLAGLRRRRVLDEKARAHHVWPADRRSGDQPG